MHTKLKFGSIALCVCALLAASPAGAKSAYVSFDPPSSLQTYATAINSEDTVAGTYFLDSYAATPGPQMKYKQSGPLTAHGFARTADGTITAFDPDNSVQTYPWCINDAGTIAGYFLDNQSVTHGFERTSDGTITVFDAPGSASYTAITGLNRKGAFTGYYYDSKFVTHGFVESGTGKFTSFDQGSATSPAAMNDAGTVAGSYLDKNVVSHGFVRAADGTLTKFDPKGSTSTYVNAIDSSGAVAGYFVDGSGVQTGFVRTPDGTIATFQVSAGKYTVVMGIDSKGDTMGSYFGGGAIHGFRRMTGGKIKSFDPVGATGTYPNSVNKSGAIAGGYYDTNNVEHGFIRMP